MSWERPNQLVKLQKDILDIIKLIKKNVLWLLIAALGTAIIWTLLYTTIFAAVGSPVAQFRYTENVVITFLTLFTISIGIIEAYTTRFEWTSENYRKRMHLIPCVFLLPVLGGNWGWLVYFIVFQICVIPFATRSTLGKLPGITVPASILMIDKTGRFGYTSNLLMKEIENKRIIKEVTKDSLKIQSNDTGLVELVGELSSEPVVGYEWDLTGLSVDTEFLKDIGDEYLKIANQFNDLFPHLTVWYGEDMWDPTEKLIVYQFSRQPLDENLTVGNSKLMMGYSGIKEGNIVIDNEEYYGYKIFVFDLIPFFTDMKNTGLYPNAELLDHFVKTHLTWNKQFNNMMELREENDILRNMNDSYGEAFEKLKSVSGMEIRKLQNLLGLHTEEFGIEDIKITKLLQDEKKPKPMIIPIDYGLGLVILAVIIFIIGIIMMLS